MSNLNQDLTRGEEELRDEDESRLLWHVEHAVHDRYCENECRSFRGPRLWSQTQPQQPQKPEAGFELTQRRLPLELPLRPRDRSRSDFDGTWSTQWMTVTVKTSLIRCGW